MIARGELEWNDGVYWSRFGMDLFGILAVNDSMPRKIPCYRREICVPMTINDDIYDIQSSTLKMTQRLVS